MKDEFSTDEMHFAPLDAWEELLTEVLHAQSASLRSVLRIVHSEQSESSYSDQVIEFSDKQVVHWAEIEEEFLHVVFQSIKNIEHPLGYTPERGKSTAFEFLDHWGNRTGKTIEAHTDFYSLIFPWDDGDFEAIKETGSLINDPHKQSETTVKAA